MLFIYMNNNSIEFTKKYLKYKYKYITLKDQSFSTYDTKIKQIGGAYDFVCVIDKDGPFASVKECYRTSSPAAPVSSFDNPPRPVAASQPPRIAGTPTFGEELAKKAAARQSTSSDDIDTKIKENKDTTAKLRPESMVFAALNARRQNMYPDDTDDDDNKYLKYKHKYLKYKHKYITLKDQLFSTYNTKIKQI
jgi:hypothetical protein